MKFDFSFDKKKLKSWLLYLGIIALGIIFDQVTKSLAVEFLSLNRKPSKTVNIIGDFLRLRYAENTGMAFSMLSDSRWVFMSVSTVAILAMIFYLLFAKDQPLLYTVSVAVIASGGIGNMIDRFFLGYVIDFVDVKYFAVFNGADSLVCVGAGLLCLAMVLDIIKESKNAKEKRKSETKE
jgi:signal peptidase II